jgi:hypothetical protein
VEENHRDGHQRITHSGARSAREVSGEFLDCEPENGAVGEINATLLFGDVVGGMAEIFIVNNRFDQSRMGP